MDPLFDGRQLHLATNETVATAAQPGITLPFCINLTFPFAPVTVASISDAVR